MAFRVWGGTNIRVVSVSSYTTAFIQLSSYIHQTFLTSTNKDETKRPQLELELHYKLQWVLRAFCIFRIEFSIYLQVIHCTAQMCANKVNKVYETKFMKHGLNTKKLLIP